MNERDKRLSDLRTVLIQERGTAFMEEHKWIIDLADEMRIQGAKEVQAELDAMTRERDDWKQGSSVEAKMGDEARADLERAIGVIRFYASTPRESEWAGNVAEPGKLAREFLASLEVEVK